MMLSFVIAVQRRSDEKNVRKLKNIHPYLIRTSHSFLLFIVLIMLSVSTTIALQGKRMVRRTFLTSLHRHGDIDHHAALRRQSRRRMTTKGSDMVDDKSTTIQTQKNLWSVQECLDIYNNNPNKIQFIDGTFFHKGSRNGREEFLNGPRLPNAQYWDIVDIACSYELYPNDNPKKLFAMFPPESLVGAVFDWMNIKPPSKEDTSSQQIIMVYGREGTLFAPRVWYMLKQYCCPEQPVGLMKGPIEEWMALGGPVDTEQLEDGVHVCRAKDLIEKTDNAQYPVSPNAREKLVDMEYVLDLLQQEESLRPTIVDTRGSSFAKKGHIPGAVHIPYSSLTQDDNSLELKARDELENILQQALGEEKYQKLATEPILLSCGSAVSVCHMALVLKEFGYPEPLIYDGSWNEWGKDPNTPKEM